MGSQTTGKFVFSLPVCHLRGGFAAHLLFAYQAFACAINLSEIDGAGDAIRTRDIFLGKEVLYH